MILYRNVAGQELFFTLVNATTGAPVVGATVAAYLSKDSGPQAAGTGTVDDLGHGQYRYNFSALDTNGGTVGLALTAADCVPLSYSWTTTAPRLPLSAGAGAGPSLITLEQAKWQLRITTQAGSPADPIEAEILSKMAEAEAIILDYLKTPDPAWVDANSTPAVVRAAILIELVELWRFRGDDPEGKGPAPTGDVSPTIASILRRYRDPALA